MAPSKRHGRVIFASGGLENAVESKHLVAHAGSGELNAGALGLGERRQLGAADQNESGDLWIAERANAGGVEVALVL